MEEHFDNDQYGALVGEYLYAAKTAMPMHDAAVNTKTGTTEPNIILDDDKELQKPFVALYDKISSYDFDDK